MLSRLLLTCLISPIIASGEEVINPYPRPVLEETAVQTWQFPAQAEGWILEKHLERGEAGILRSTGEDPILVSPPIQVEARATVMLRMKTTAAGPGQVFWVAQGAEGPSETARTEFATQPDGEWHEYRIDCAIDEPLRAIRIDPATAAGDIEISSVKVLRRKLHPIEITAIQHDEEWVRIHVRNHAPEPLWATINRFSVQLPARDELVYRQKQQGQTVRVEVHVRGYPVTTRVSAVPSTPLDRSWMVLDGKDVHVLVDPKGQNIRLWRHRQEVGVICPIVGRLGEPVSLGVSGNESFLVLEAPDGTRVELQVVNDELHFAIQAEQEVEGPVLRVKGPLEQGLLPGVEYLGKGETSSSSLDIHGVERFRYAPPPRHVTMPFMAVLTEKAGLAMRWEQPGTAQPVFATPNFFEGTAEHRLALRGKNLRGVIRIGPGFPEERLENSILWAVQANGLPELPKPPRDAAAQMALCREAFESSELKSPEGPWYHAIIPGGRRAPETPQWFADHLSTWFRLTGEIRQEAPVPGGSHLENSAIFFLTGRGPEWLNWQTARARKLIQDQKPDGSYRYAGKFAEGHFEDTASGYCAHPAMQLLEFVRATGNAEAKEAGLRTLEFMKRFRTPRGAQTWECPLHAPDLLASAYLVKAYLLGYELTGNPEYKDLATRWAVSGVPFIYQWPDRPTMLYATTATLCATNYEAPVWIGRPVQWCGLVYADAILDLAPYDTSIDWRKLAEGILISGEQQQYTAGTSKGLLADSLLLDSQKLAPYDINPDTLVYLRQRLENKVPGLAIVRDEKRVVVSPFPTRLENGKAIIEATPGVNYQVLVDGKAWLPVKSQGRDELPLP